MKNFLILTNEKKDPGLRISKHIQEYIERSGGTSYRMCDFTREISRKISAALPKILSVSLFWEEMEQCFTQHV